MSDDGWLTDTAAAACHLVGLMPRWCLLATTSQVTTYMLAWENGRLCSVYELLTAACGLPRTAFLCVTTSRCSKHRPTVLSFCWSGQVDPPGIQSVLAFIHVSRHDSIAWLTNCFCFDAETTSPLTDDRYETLTYFVYFAQINLTNVKAIDIHQAQSCVDILCFRKVTTRNRVNSMYVQQIIVVCGAINKKTETWLTRLSSLTRSL